MHKSEIRRLKQERDVWKRAADKWRESLKKFGRESAAKTQCVLKLAEAEAQVTKLNNKLGRHG